MHSNKHLYLLILICFTFISCNKNKTEEREKVSKELEANKKEVTYILKFPDTVILGNKNKGLIEYSSILDTVKLNTNDKRYILFYAAAHKDSLELEELLKKEHDTFVSIGEGKIPIYDLSFTKKGVNYLDGYIEDQVIIFGHNGDSTKSRIITKTTKVYKHVVVVDSLELLINRVSVKSDKM